MEECHRNEDPVFSFEEWLSKEKRIPLYEKITKEAPQPLRTLIASGDVFIDVNGALPASLRQLRRRDSTCVDIPEHVDPSSLLIF